MASAQTADFDVRHYGAVGDGKADDRPAIQRAIDAASHSSHASRVLIPAGNYLLGPQDAGQPGQLSIVNAHSLTLIGSPSTTLISTVPQSSIVVIKQSSDIHVQQLVLDRRPLLFTQGIVKSIDAEHKIATLEIDPKYDELDSHYILPQKWLIVYSDPASGTWGDHSAACAFFKPADPVVCWPPSIVARKQTGPRLWEVTLNTAPQADYVSSRFVVWSGTYKGRGLMIERSKDVFLQDVTYYGGGAEAYVVDHNSGTISFSHFTICVPPGSDRLVSTVGGMIFNNHAAVLMDHVDLSHMWDDAVNIGANFARVYQQVSPTVLRVDGSRGDFLQGDRLAVWDWPSKAQIAEVHITKLRCEDRSSCLITLDKPVMVAHPGYAPVKSTGNDTDGIDRVIDLDSAGTIHITNSSFQSLHARCLLIKSSTSVVENSICHDTVMAGILVGPQFFWDEGPEVHDLTVRNNDFRNVSGANILVSNGGSPNAPAITGLVVSGNNFFDYARYEHGVDVRSGAAILLQNTANPVLSGNTFATRYKKDCCAVSVEEFDKNFEIK
jgi:hypothetical protein